MSEKPAPRVGISTAAETAWFEQEAQAEAHGLERASGVRRVVALLGVGFAVVAGVAVVALLVASPRGTARAAGPVALEVAAPALVPAAPAAATQATVVQTPPHAATKPTVTKRAATKPTVTKRAVTKPAVTKPAVATRAVMRPAVTKPAVTKPAAKPAPKRVRRPAAAVGR